MSSCPKVVTEPDQVSARLAEIGGLTISLLLDVVMQGEMARDNCTANYPVTAGGTFAYHERVRALRDRLLLDGWTKKFFGGSELTITPDGEHAVIVASGDDNTGSESDDPKTRSPKGTRVQEAAAANEAQTEMFPDLARAERAMIEAREKWPATYTWILLVRRDDEKVDSELSMPTGIDEGRRPAIWAERLILPSFDMGDGDGLRLPRTPEPGLDFDVEITRKTG